MRSALDSRGSRLQQLDNLDERLAAARVLCRCRCRGHLYTLIALVFFGDILYPPLDLRREGVVRP
jgi:hypothetical protein